MAGIGWHRGGCPVAGNGACGEQLVCGWNPLVAADVVSRAFYDGVGRAG